jgi:hypothetical protein
MWPKFSETTLKGENSAVVHLSDTVGWVKLHWSFRNFCIADSASLSCIFIRTSVSSFCYRFVLNNGVFSGLPDSPLTSWNRLFLLHSVTTCRKRKQHRPCSAVATLSRSSRRWLKANTCSVCVCVCVCVCVHRFNLLVTLSPYRAVACKDCSYTFFRMSQLRTTVFDNISHFVRLLLLVLHEE